MSSVTETSWPFEVRPLARNLGAAIAGVDLAEDLSEEVFRALYRAYLHYQVLLFPPHELIVWDNRCVLHRATAYDPLTQGRVIRRCTVLGEVPA